MDKYLLTKGKTYYSEESNDFVSDIKKAKRFDTISAATKKKNKLYKKIFGNISILTESKKE